MKSSMNVIDEENNIGEYRIICTFDSEFTGKSYVIYTDNKKGEDGKLLIMSGSYEKKDENTIRVDRNLSNGEYEMISEIMKNLIKKAEEYKNENEDLTN